MAGRDAPSALPGVAARALERARKLDAAGRYEEALLNLRVVEASLPRIADHIAFMRAELYTKYRDDARAADAYAKVIAESPSIELRARARVGRVRSLLRAGADNAEAELSALLARYPELPEAASLRLELARHREITGQVRSAIAIYRAIDLTWPGYPMAAEARERLAVLAGRGHPVAAFTEQEQLERATRLMRSGPIEQARATIMALRSQSFSAAFRQQRDALVESFEALEQRRFARVDQSPVEDEPDPEFEQLRQRVGLRRGEKQLAKLKPGQMLAQLERAASLRLTNVADALVGEFTRRVRSTSPKQRFAVLVAAIGTASDDALIKLADTLLSSKDAVAVRYHRARALERAGRVDEAVSELRRVQALDDSATRFYATWAEQRLRALDGSVESCRMAGRAGGCNQVAIESALSQLEQLTPLDLPRATERIEAVAATHGDAFPWFARALDLVRLSEAERASDELYEAYLAYRLAVRRGSVRAGREAVYRGTSITRAATDAATLRGRLQLDSFARSQLAEAATALGDAGLAVNFGGLAYAEQQPFPYASEVARAARKYGLDPDLLFAVMRVESVYQRRIISHAGAIGLMQIMPRTGRLIADKLGQPEMTATDLLDPKTNIAFSAWYLSSLIDRMDGRLPLAIASYNGGPHNVRAWIRRYGTHVPLDAFLERIPFQETRRYVRRVLGFYASYKAMRGQQVDLMAIRLPSEDRPGEVAF